MTAVTQSAAYETVDEVLGSVTNCHGPDFGANKPNFPTTGRVQGEPDFSRGPGELNGPRHGYGHQRDGSDGGNGKDGMMPPPPPRRQAGYANHGFGSCSDHHYLSMYSADSYG